MTSSNPNSPTNSPLNFRPFALGKRGPKFRFIPTNSVGLAKPVITQALQTGGDAIQVTWGESGGTSYALQVSTNGGTTFSDVTTTAGTSFTHTGLSFPGSYTYRVRATVDAEVSDWSDSVTETMVDVPAAPGGLTVTGATTSSISLSWNDAADEGSYLVEVSVDGLGSWTSAGSTNQNVVTFTHSGLAESVQRHYRVTAFNKAGGSIPSSTTNSWTVPAAPTGLTATAISTTQIDLSWTDVSTGNQSYRVERSTDNTNWTEIATGLSATATTYSATGLTASTQYWFRVRAANAARNSDYSSSATATTQASTTVPNAPSGFNATSTFADSVSLSWTDNSSGTGQETGFNIEVSTNAGSTYSSVTTTAANATSFSHTGRVESTTYLYRIRATNSAGSSSWVVGDNVTTTAAITGFTATAASSTQINLAWTDKSGVETGFRIERSTDNTNWSLVTTTAANATSFSNTGLNASTLYYYRIRSNSYNGTNDSAWYSASATTNAAAGSTLEYLVVAGGGGGGGAGGGGAGGYKTATGFSLTVGTSYTVTVGAGGAGGATGTDRGTDGSNSVFSTVTSTGGGGGGSWGATTSGRSGGSGGGQGNTPGSPGTGTSGEGNDGGTSPTSAAHLGCGGGGGADAVGGNGSNSGAGQGGNGGAGKTFYSTVYAGGGGGLGQTNAGTGGSGGGGNGRNSSGGNTAGTANRGGGGGAGYNTAGSSGGSGIVILRMASSTYSGLQTGAPTVSTSGSDTILTYNASGTYTGGDSSTYYAEYLVVAGGGGGARGGGGAGGYRTATGFSLTVGTSYTVTVGAGGAGGTPFPTTAAANGSDSVFSTITSTGGGRAGNADNGASGGSGGGGGVDSGNKTGGAGTSGQGNAGGDQTHGSAWPLAAAGGGGASAAGGNSTASGTGGNGGAGTASSITGSSVTYAGGGGGGVYGGGGTAAGTGGAGGGGAGGLSPAAPIAGTANRGGGGGGGNNSNSGAAGGSGIVILRVPAARYSGTTTGSPTVTDDGQFKVLTFNASGSYTA